MPHNDGFGFPGLAGTPWLKHPIWYNHTAQDVYYLHGALHLFENESLYKLAWNSSGTLHSQVIEMIENNVYPLVVFEGESINKVERINKSPYLWYAYKELKCLDGTLVILGSSLNDSDDHIIQAIKNSKVEKIYFGLHNSNNHALVEKVESLRSDNKQVYFFNSKEAISWECKDL